MNLGSLYTFLEGVKIILLKFNPVSFCLGYGGGLSGYFRLTFEGLFLA